MSVATASKEAYGRMRSAPPKEHPVYKFLKSAGAGSPGYNNRQISLIMKRPINTITPRIFELRAAGVVVLAGKRKDLYSGIEVSHWRIATEAEEQAFKHPAEAREILTGPRTWMHLADIPEGVIVKETTRAGWHWLRRGGGQFGFTDSQMVDKTFGGWAELQGNEAFYGPMTEVL